jgi:hypothetical protein
MAMKMARVSWLDVAAARRLIPSRFFLHIVEYAGRAEGISRGTNGGQHSLPCTDGAVVRALRAQCARRLAQACSTLRPAIAGFVQGAQAVHKPSSHQSKKTKWISRFLSGRWCESSAQSPKQRRGFPNSWRRGVI